MLTSPRSQSVVDGPRGPNGQMSDQTGCGRKAKSGNKLAPSGGPRPRHSCGRSLRCRRRHRGVHGLFLVPFPGTKHGAVDNLLLPVRGALVALAGLYVKPLVQAAV